MIIMCMTTIKNKVRICPFIYIVCLLLFAACSNEDNAGKDIPSATFSIAPERGQIEGEIQFTNASYGVYVGLPLLRIPANKIREESLSAQMALYMPH